jgi:hypothetical protein
MPPGLFTEKLKLIFILIGGISESGEVVLFGNQKASQASLFSE